MTSGGGASIDTLCDEVRELREELREFRICTKDSLEEVKDTMRMLKDEMKDIRHEVAELKEGQHTNRLDIVALSDNTDSLVFRVKAIEQKMERADRQSRRDNLLFHGIHEEQDEDAKGWSVEVLRTLVPQRTWKDSDIVKAHRIGQRRPNHTRPLLVRFADAEGKMAILGKKETFRGKGIGVTNDFTTLQRQELKDARDRGQKGFYRNGRLQVEDFTPRQTYSNRNQNLGPQKHHHQDQQRQHQQQPAQQQARADGIEQQRSKSPNRSNAPKWDAQSGPPMADFPPLPPSPPSPTFQPSQPTSQEERRVTRSQSSSQADGKGQHSNSTAETTASE